MMPTEGMPPGVGDGRGVGVCWAVREMIIGGPDRW